MGLTAGILLTAIGAVLAFAVHATVSGLDIRTLGWIVMAAGVAGVLLELIMFAPRRRSVMRTTYPAAGTVRTVVHQDDVI